MSRRNSRSKQACPDLRDIVAGLDSSWMNGAGIRGRDEKGLREIDHAAHAIGDAIVHRLEKIVRTSGCAFSSSSRRTRPYGRLRTASGQEAAGRPARR